MSKGRITSRRSPATISHHGIAAAAAAYLLLALAWSMVTPAQWGTDESSNVAYGYHIARVLTVILGLGGVLATGWLALLMSRRVPTLRCSRAVLSR